MPKLIYDEFTNQPISRQLRYQRRKNATGRCRLCGAQARLKSPFCEMHRDMAAASKAGRMPFVPKSATTEILLPVPESAPTFEEII